LPLIIKPEVYPFMQVDEMAEDVALCGCFLPIVFDSSVAIGRKHLFMRQSIDKI
jgi:hypothetical protein